MKRTATIVFTLILVVSATSSLQGFFRTGSSYAAFPWVKDGAIQIERMRIPWNEVESYMKYYKDWFEEADKDDSSGRKLLGAMVKEHGDPYNVVFIYRYDHSQKIDYYCKYSKAFWAKNKAKITHTVDQKTVLTAAMKQAITTQVEACLKTGIVPDELVKQIRAKDSKLREKIDLDQASWNREVDWTKVP